MAAKTKKQLALSDEAWVILDDNASERKRGEFIEGLLFAFADEGSDVETSARNDNIPSLTDSALEKILSHVDGSLATEYAIKLAMIRAAEAGFYYGQNPVKLVIRE